MTTTRAMLVDDDLPRSRPALLARQGVTLPRNVTTTYHLGAAYPFAVEAGLGVKGAFMGRNRLSGGGGFFFDLFAAHAAGLITAPNMCLTGAGGFGKSALAKTYVFRSSVFKGAHARGRFVFIIDAKGEWATLARTMGLTIVDLHPGGSARVNPLDPGPAGATQSAAELARTQAPVISALLSVILARRLDVSETRVLGHALTRISAQRLTHPTLADLRDLLARPSHDMAAELDTTHDELRARSRPLLDACAAVLDHQYQGMFDGPTTVDVDWDHSPGLVINLSAVLDQAIPLELAMISAAGWGQALMHGHRDRHKLTVIDESYKALQNPAMVSYFLDAWKVGRQFGAANIIIIHALSELRAQFDDGAAALKQTEALLNTTSVKVYLRQHHDQAADLLARFGLTTAEARLLPTMPPHQALWKIGDYTALVDHDISGPELDFCDTNTVMRGGASDHREQP
jgi:type IV secretory pathway VirB4 component